MNTNRLTGRLSNRAIGVALWSILGCAGLLGQTGEHGSDIGEVSAYTGAAFGGTGTHAAVGGTTGVTMSKYAVALVDTSFVPLGSRTLIRFPGVTASSRLFDFNFTVHIQVPVSRHWAPYALLGTALLYNTYRVEVIRPLDSTYFRGESDVKFGFEAGGGARYYVRDDWGFKGEYRYTITTHNFSRILGGVFYQFSGESWPFLPRRGKRHSGGSAH